MRINLLMLLGIGLVATPLAAQTVVPAPSTKPTEAPATPAKKSGINENAIVDKLRNVTEFGNSGYDVVAFSTRPRTVRGTPFLVPGWSRGEVVFGTNAKATAGVLKFDIFNQEVRVLVPEGDSIILAPGKIQAFTLRPTGADGKPAERRFERLPSGAVPEAPVSFAEVLSSGAEVRLLKSQRKIIRKGQYDPSYNSKSPEDFYQPATQYFLRWADGTVVPVKPSVGGIIGVVASRQPAAVAAEMQQKPKAKSDAELGELVQRLNAAIPAK